MVGVKSYTKKHKNKILNSPLWTPQENDYNYNCNEDTSAWFNIDTNVPIKKSNTYIKLEEKKDIVRATQIKLFLDKRQSTILKEWIEVHRRVYNLAVLYERTNKTILSFIDLRKVIDEEIDKMQKLTNTIEKCGIKKQVRDSAIKDYTNSRKSAFSNLRNKNIKHFKLGYKGKTSVISTICIPKGIFSKEFNTFSVRTLGIIKTSEPFGEINYDCKLSYNAKTKTFILIKPVKHNAVAYKDRNKTCSLDPGMRIFQTIYSPGNKLIGNICNGDNPKLEKLIKRLEKEKIGLNKKQTEKVNMKIRQKIKSKINDMHNKTVNILCRSYDEIIIGDMSTQGIVSNKNNLPKQTKRLAHVLSHFTFRQKLIAKAEEYSVNVVVGDERYTSKACGKCGELHENLGANKVFTCPHCAFKISRDVNGARNIMIQNIERNVDSFGHTLVA